MTSLKLVDAWYSAEDRALPAVTRTCCVAVISPTAGMLELLLFVQVAAVLHDPILSSQYTCVSFGTEPVIS